MFHFTFSIRDILWLTLLVALGLTWYGHNQQRAKEMAKLSEQIETQQKENQQLRNAALASEIAYKEQVRTTEVISRTLKEMNVENYKRIVALEAELRSREFPRTRYLLEAFEPKQ